MNTTKPISDRIIVKPIADSKQTSGGLFIASAASMTTPTATVIAVGPGRRTATGVLVPMQVAVGDIIAYAAGTGVKSKINEVDVLFMTEENILGILSED
jgi:chaperonin GroES|tara:strand:- start:447 stop:743 length:297 start_codon:yes stop_codon:yes gene_type:complete